MALQLVIGGSGVGKSYYMCNEIIKESIVNQDKTYLVVVPEQFTLQTQKNIVNMHPEKGILNIDVLSFMRLAYRIFDELGKKNNIVLEDTGKNMIIRKIIELKKDELNIFKGNIRKQGFISEIKSLISELYQYSINEEDINKIINNTNDNIRLQNKFKEVLIIYSAFKEYLEDKYITSEEILDILYEIIEQSQMLKECVMCLDGFTGFTPIQYKLLAKIMKLCDKVMISVTIDPKEDLSEVNSEHRLFDMSRKTISKLCAIAKENDVEINDNINVGEIYKNRMNNLGRFAMSEALAHLEANIFRYPYSKYAVEQKDIHINSVSDIDSEAEMVIGEIKKLVSEEDYRYRDIAIVTGNIAAYARVFEDKFERENMPYFVDNKKSIMDNPMIEMIEAFFEIVRTNFSYESVFRYLRSGMSRITSEEADILENYVIALGKKGLSAWKKEWDRTYNTRAVIDLNSINESREKVCYELEDAFNSVKKCKSVNEYCIVIYDFLLKLDCEKKLNEYSDKFDEEGMITKAKEYRQVYPNVMELLDKMVDLLSDEKVSLKEYAEIFEAGVSEVKVGLIPMTIDQIVLGDIERTRLNDIKAMFFMGVNDGVIPKENGSGGLISDLERELLNDMGIELAPTNRQSSYIEQFYLYMMLTKPKNKLYLSYSKMNGDGGLMKESYLISKIMKIFPLLKIEDNTEDIIKNNYGRDYLADGLRKKDPINMDSRWKQILVWHLTDNECKKEVKSLIDGAYYTSMNLAISTAAADAIYGNKDKSVTEIEKYASCAYAHFLQYGLKLKERTEYEIRVPDIGIIFHDVIDRFSNGIKSGQYDWSNIPDEERISLSDRCVIEAVEEYGNKIMYSSRRNEYMVERIKRMAQRTTWALCRHIKEGDFKPAGFEIGFSSADGISAVNHILEDGRKIGLRGAIDRIDICSDDDNEYVKVIDYKSGSRNFEPALFLEGIQLQLIVYMNVAIDKAESLKPGKNIIPAGVFYYTIDDPIIDKDAGMICNKNSTEEIVNAVISTINEKKLDKLVMHGIINKNPSVISKLERRLVDDEGKLIPKLTSKVIKASVASDGALSKNSNSVDTCDFDRLRRHASELIRNNTKQMYDGVVKARPYKSAGVTACDYCQYKGICRFDIKMNGNSYRKITPKTMDEVIEEVR